MSTDQRVTTDLIETLEDGKKGFAQAADHLAETDRAGLADQFRRFSEKRASFSQELERLAASYGDDIDESGSVAATVHRAWMTIKDAIAGDDPDGVLDVAAQGEEHAVAEFEKALDEDISPGLRAVVARQLAAIRHARDTVRTLRESV